MRPIVRANFRVFQRDQYFGCHFFARGGLNTTFLPSHGNTFALSLEVCDRKEELATRAIMK